jgi:hypothetical protein
MKHNDISTTTEAPKSDDAIKDAGRVRYGSGSIRFTDVPAPRDVTKDAGRVRYGSGSIQF